MTEKNLSKMIRDKWPETEAFGEDIMRAEVTVQLDGRYLISWTGGADTGDILIHGGLSPETIDRSVPLASVTNQSEAVISGLDRKDRHYFEISPAKGRPLVVAERLVVMEGSHNFRDLGGYLARDGRRVKWGKLYRSDALTRLTESDLDKLIRMGIKSVIDFRSREEAEKAPDRLPGQDRITYRHWPIQTGEMNFINALEHLKQGDYSWLTDDYMIRGYKKNIDHYPTVWGRAINYLAGPDALPLVFHCTGGKDRAGTFAALVLAVLGVPDDTIVYDHQLTNFYIQSLLPKFGARLAKYGIDPEKVRPYFLAPAEGIPVVLEEIRARYRSVDDYLIGEGGVPAQALDRLRDTLLENG